MPQQLLFGFLFSIVHPRAVVPITLGGMAVDANVLQPVLAFMLVYGAVMVAATMLLGRLALFSILVLFTGPSGAGDRRPACASWPHG